MGATEKLIWAYVSYCLLRTVYTVVMSITTPLVEFFGKGNEAKGYLITMTIYGVLAMFIFFITFASTKEVVPPSVKREKTSLREDLKALTG